MTSPAQSSKDIHVLRVYHAGGPVSHQARERALERAGIELTLVVPTAWEDEPATRDRSTSSHRVVELPIARPGDVNRHRYRNARQLARVVRDVSPDILDIHEEPFSASARQWLAAAPRDLGVVMYTAQNVDKRLPPPFARYERTAFRRVAALYPCSRQAASVARGKGFDGHIDVLPLGYADEIFRSGGQSLGDGEMVIVLAGRLVAAKGVLDAVAVAAAVSRARPARLLLVGQGPAERAVLDLAASLGVRDRVEILPWQTPEGLADVYRRAHVVLVPSRATRTWVEQFGRVIVEAQASGAVVAGYRSGSIPEVAGEAGLLVVEGDVDGLAEQVTTLLGDPDEFARRQALGLEQTQLLTWTHIAKRHADLYRRVAAGELAHEALPRSPTRRRAIARAEFGPTAETAAGARPFALPVLRRRNALTRLLAAAIDAAVEARARML